MRTKREPSSIFAARLSFPIARPVKDMTTQPESGKNFPLIVKHTASAVIAQMITFLSNTADSMFVAKIDGSGMDAPAALGIFLPVTLIMIVIFTMFPKIFKRREEYVKNCPQN